MMVGGSDVAVVIRGVEYNRSVPVRRAFGGVARHHHEIVSGCCAAGEGLCQDVFKTEGAEPGAA
jgi:hypothetical protein